MNRKNSWVTALILITFAAVGGGSLFGYMNFTQRGPLKSDLIVIIPKGSGIDFISRLLERKGAISQPILFKLTVLILRLEKVMRAGEFSIPKGSSPRDILSILRSGKMVIRRFVAVEGLYTAEILGQLRRADGLTGIVTGTPKEGELLPETYHYNFGDNRNDLVRRMKVAMKNVSEELWLLREVGLPIKTPLEAIILASIVEKETGLVEERRRVASVFINRLRLGMRLQSDPTVIYGLTNGNRRLSRPLKRKDLKSPNPYNTYLNKGLPPGPIANPGRASIKAVLNPIESTDLYFVADGKGGHAFSTTLSEHNKNVKVLRKLEREKMQTR